MARAPKKQSATSKGSSKPKAPAKSQTAPKPKFDTEAFVFDTPIEKIEEAIKRLEEQAADPMAEWPTKDETYWWCWWLINMPEVKRRGMTTVPVCAKEAAVLGLYDKPKGRRKK